LLTIDVIAVIAIAVVVVIQFAQQQYVIYLVSEVSEKIKSERSSAYSKCLDEAMGKPNGLTTARVEECSKSIYGN